MSANKAVTSRRSDRGLVAFAEPQWPQNAVPSGFVAEHVEHRQGMDGL
jgi:hypothetical protein